VNHLACRWIEGGEQHELLTVLDHGSLVEQNRGRKLGDGL
jgi:hypothetical protein